MFDHSTAPSEVRVRHPRIADIQAVFCAKYGIGMADIKGHCRKRIYSWPRQRAVWMSRKLTPYSYPHIARCFGGIDHSTCIHAYRKIEREIVADPVLAAELAELEASALRIAASRPVVALPPLPETEPKSLSAASVSRPAPRLKEIKPKTVHSLDQDAWLSLGGELEGAR